MGVDYSKYNQKTFKQMKRVREGSRRFELSNFLKTTVGQGNLREAVKLPRGEDLNEWLAVNIIDFYNQISIIYGHVQEHCTQKTCPKMSAGPKYEWFWADGVNIKDPIGVSAPEYVDYLMEWVSSQFEDPALFPPKDDVPFPPDFAKKLKVIFKRLFRVYAHVYYHHIDIIKQEDAEPDLNNGFKHFYLFVRQFDLVEMRDMIPLEHLTKKIDEKTKQREKERKSKLRAAKKEAAAATKSTPKRTRAPTDPIDDDDDSLHDDFDADQAENDEHESQQTTFYHDEPDLQPTYQSQPGSRIGGDGKEEKRKRRETKVEYS